MFGKKKENKKKIVEKLVMGAVIGGAIGSVIGASIAPKKGAETRKDIAQGATTAVKTSGKLFGLIKRIVLRKFKKLKPGMKKIPNEMEALEDEKTH